MTRKEVSNIRNSVVVIYLIGLIGWGLYNIFSGNINFGDTNVNTGNLVVGAFLLIFGFPLLFGFPPAGIIALIAGYIFFSDFLESLDTIEVIVPHSFYIGTEYIGLIMTVPLIYLFFLVLSSKSSSLKSQIGLLFLIFFAICVLFAKFYFVESYSDLGLVAYLFLQIIVSFFIASVNSQSINGSSSAFNRIALLIICFVIIPISILVYLDIDFINTSQYYLVTLFAPSIFVLSFLFFPKLFNIKFSIGYFFGVIIGAVVINFFYISIFFFDYPHNTIGLVIFVLFMLAWVNFSISLNSEDDIYKTIILYIAAFIFTIFIALFEGNSFWQILDIIFGLVLLGGIVFVIFILIEKVPFLGYSSAILLVGFLVLEIFLPPVATKIDKVLNDKAIFYTKVTQGAKLFFDKEKNKNMVLIPIKIGMLDFTNFDKQSIKYNVSGLSTARLDKKGNVLSYEKIDSLNVVSGVYNKFDTLYYVFSLVSINSDLRKEENRYSTRYYITNISFNYGAKKINKYVHYNSSIFKEINTEVNFKKKRFIAYELEKKLGEYSKRPEDSNFLDRLAGQVYYNWNYKKEKFYDKSKKKNVYDVAVNKISINAKKKTIVVKNLNTKSKKYYNCKNKFKFSEHKKGFNILTCSPKKSKEYYFHLEKGL